ncbi:hypothetical protein C1H46_026397 [Malus baccata]|uniref:Uncharacterized protein n=1 Tax=Malus baccata TaxID=106549 RepID=A0A540LNH5_MALBA|nr:hypothetical protein C1H46_026397 [Malus baccata]
MNTAEGRQTNQVVLDLNEKLMGEDDIMAILPYVAPPKEPLLSPSQPLLLFGTEILTSNVWQWVFIHQDSPLQNSMSVWRLGNEVVRDVGKKSYNHQVEPTLSLGSDPFNLDPFIFGTGNLDRKNFKQRLGRNKGNMMVNHSKFVLPELGKRMDREGILLEDPMPQRNVLLQA